MISLILYCKGVQDKTMVNNKLNIFEYGNEMNEDRDLFDAENNDDEIYSPISNRKLYLDKTDKSTSDILRMHDSKEIVLQPNYQRKFVWSAKVSSKFIESLLLGIPIPTIFLNERSNYEYEVVDGQQRLTALINFMKNEMRLTGLETLEKYNRCKYVDLDKDIQRRFNNVSLPIVTVLKDSDEDIKYDIFSRINQGSVKLNNQELYWVLYRGVLLEKIKMASENSKLKSIIGERRVFFDRLFDQEMLVRFLAMRMLVNKEYKISDKYGGRLNKVIVEFLNKYKEDVEFAEKAYEMIIDTIEKILKVFDNNAFKLNLQMNFESNTSINKTVAELPMFVT